MQSIKWVNGVTWVFKVKVIDLGLKSIRFQNSNSFFWKIAGPFETKFYIKAHGRKEMKIYSNKFGHMTKMGTMAIYDKNPSKIFSGTSGPIALTLAI